MRLSPVLAVLLLTLACTPIGCGTSSKPMVDPAATSRDHEASPRKRIRAIHAITAQHHAGTLATGEYREQLKRVAWSRSTFSSVRVAAIDALLENDADDTATMLSYMLPSETHFDVVQRAADLAATHQWHQTVPGFVRSLANTQRFATDFKERPEYTALHALAPNNDLVAMVFGLFLEQPEMDDALRKRLRLDAWTLLGKLNPKGDRVRALLETHATTTHSDDTLLHDLRAAIEFGNVPMSREGLEYLRLVRTTADGTLWSTAVDAANTRTPSQRKGLSIRHASLLAWASANDPTLLTKDANSLRSELGATFRTRKTHRRTATLEDLSSSNPETIHAWRKSLAWGDLLAIAIANRCIADQAVRTDIFEQTDQDRRDTSTEHGGLLGPLGTPAALRAVAYPPRPTQRVGDNTYPAPPELFESAGDALFFYHMHAQSSRTAGYAGPSPGDTEFLVRHCRSGLVFSYIDADTINVDYYQPNGAVVDLGEIAR